MESTAGREQRSSQAICPPSLFCGDRSEGRAAVSRRISPRFSSKDPNQLNWVNFCAASGHSSGQFELVARAANTLTLDEAKVLAQDVARALTDTWNRSCGSPPGKARSGE